MTAIVVPFRGADGKQRLAPSQDEARVAIALAMLADVLAACSAVARTIVVTDDEAGRKVAVELGVAALDDLRRLEGRLGPRTQMAVAMAGLVPVS